nr:GNAT family N-acetyltransferase [Burkholderia sp. Tr-862]
MRGRRCIPFPVRAEGGLPAVQIDIRCATVTDVPQILRFITELAIYEKAEHEVVATPASLERSLFGEGLPARALICEVDGEPAGFAVYFFSYSTWLGRQGLYLEDLYVSPRFRGAGAGLRLLKALARIAVDTGCGRFEWSVLDWNEPAIRFYESVGAAPQSEWVRYRLAGDALRAFADGAPVDAA